MNIHSHKHKLKLIPKRKEKEIKGMQRFFFFSKTNILYYISRGTELR